MNFARVLGLTLVCMVLPAIAPAKAATLESSIATESRIGIVSTRLDELKRGINLSHWFWGSDFNPTYITDRDLQTIKNLGFEHVRLPIDPLLLFDENNPETLNVENLGYLDTALDSIAGRDLSAIVTLYPDDTFKQRLANDDTFVDKVARFWRTLAAHFSDRSPEGLFLEPINEPAFGAALQGSNIDPIQRWHEVQTELLNAMREAAPDRTLIATGYDWSGIDGLLALTPSEDPNVVYNFHFYNSMLFTHQGVDWLGGEFSNLHDLPYPYNQSVCEEVLPTLVESARGWAQGYCDERWDATKIEAQIARAAAWAQEHNVPLIADEFGAYRSAVRLDDRMNWIADVRSSLEKYQIGWTMWDYVGGFGLTTEQDGNRTVDRATAQALALPGINYSGTTPNPNPIPGSSDPETRKVPEPSAIAGLTLLAIAGIKRISRQ